MRDHLTAIENLRGYRCNEQVAFLAAVDALYQEAREVVFDARVALPEAQERFKRAEANVERLRAENARLEHLDYENERLRAELAKHEAVMVAADRLHEAYAAMLNGEDVGWLAEWQPKPATDDALSEREAGA